MAVVTRMKSLFLLASLILGFVMFNHNAQAAPGEERWGPVTGGFQVGAEFTQELYEPEEPLMIRFTIRNVGDKAVRTMESYPEMDFKVTVIKDGTDIVEPKWVPSSVWRNVRINLEPGEECSYEYRLWKTYNLSAPGEYEIRAERWFLDNNSGKWTSAKANPIFLTVTEQGATGRPFYAEEKIEARAPETATPARQETTTAKTEKRCGAISDGFQLGAEFTQETYGPGEQLAIRLSLTNTSDEPRAMWETYPEMDFQVSVIKDVTKVMVPIWEPSDILRNHLITFKPKEQKIFEYRLWKTYDLSAPGNYEICAERSFPAKDKEVFNRVKANPVYLTVLEKMAIGRPFYEKPKPATDEKVGEQGAKGK